MTARLVEVRRTERLIPRMVRVLFGGELVGFAAGSFTDHYVKIRFPPPGAPYAAPFKNALAKERLPVDQWPRTPPTRCGTSITNGKSSRWTSSSTATSGWPDGGLSRRGPATSSSYWGPGGAYVPRLAADWHLLIADDSVIPRSRRP